jgi:ubiquinone/menaquinone biosynthesis C-methylase UbiE
MPTPYYKQHWIEIDADRLAVYDTLLRYEPRMEPLLAPLDLQPGLSVLDVGSGPGSTTMELGRRVGPSGTLVGIDINAEFVERAGAQAQAAGLHQVSFQQADFPPLPFESETFDRVFCKNVLEYVDSAEATVRDIARVTKPGGLVVLIDSDWEMLALDVSDEALHDRFMSAIKTTAMREPRIGRKLRGLCIVANLRDIKVKIFASPDLKGRARQMLENNWYQYALDSGRVTRAEADAWRDDIRTRLKNDVYCFCLPQFVVSTRKAG